MPETNTRKILVVDDDPQILEVVEQALSSKGIEVVTAASGEEALELLDNSLMVYLLDLQLPGMNGIELCRKIDELNPVGIKLAMTGYVSVFHLVECREAGFDDYFVKPFKVDFLLTCVEQALEKIARWRRGK